jgi:hypothetical protein
MYLIGFGGSLAVEVVNVCRHYERGRALPARFTKRGFWVARFVLALAAGLVAWVYTHDSPNPVLALHLGASTPVLILAFARVPPEEG